MFVKQFAPFVAWGVVRWAAASRARRCGAPAWPCVAHLDSRDFSARRLVSLVHDAGASAVGDSNGNHFRAVRGHWHWLQCRFSPCKRWQGKLFFSGRLTQPIRHNIDDWDRMMMRRDYRLTGSTRGQAVGFSTHSSMTLKHHHNSLRIASGARSAYRDLSSSPTPLVGVLSTDTQCGQVAARLCVFPCEQVRQPVGVGIPR